MTQCRKAPSSYDIMSPPEGLDQPAESSWSLPVLWAGATGRPDGKQQNNWRGEEDVLVESSPQMLKSTTQNISDSSRTPTCMSLASITLEFSFIKLQLLNISIADCHLSGGRQCGEGVAGSIPALPISCTSTCPWARHWTPCCSPGASLQPTAPSSLRRGYMRRTHFVACVPELCVTTGRIQSDPLHVFIII